MQNDSIIDKDNKLWKLFLAYENLIGAEGKEAGLDFYGSDQKTALAKDLVTAHILNDVVCVLTDIYEQNAKLERSRHHLKPQTTIHSTETSVGEDSNASI